VALAGFALESLLAAALGARHATSRRNAVLASVNINAIRGASGIVARSAICGDYRGGRASCTGRKTEIDLEMNWETLACTSEPRQHVD
jgi:hypothetical protein